MLEKEVFSFWNCRQYVHDGHGIVFVNFQNENVRRLFILMMVWDSYLVNSSLRGFSNQQYKHNLGKNPQLY